MGTTTAAPFSRFYGSPTHSAAKLRNGITPLGAELREGTQEDTLCSFCDFNRRGPRIVQCEVYQVPFSDHAPFRFSLFVPRLEDIHAIT